jgi:hypothetical protein
MIGSFLVVRHSNGGTVPKTEVAVIIIAVKIPTAMSGGYIGIIRSIDPVATARCKAQRMDVLLG